MEMIKGNTCLVFASGKSLEEFERRKEEFKDLRAIWVGLNYFKLSEDFILKKISKRFNIVFDCAEVSHPEIYEPQHRVPILNEYLSRKEPNFWITAYNLLKQMRQTGQNEFVQKHKNKIVILNEILLLPEFPTEVKVRPPNSLSYLLSVLTYWKAKKIIIFGFDGLLKDDNRSNEENIQTYYKAEFVRQERILGCGWLHPGILAWDSEQFDERFPKIFEIYKEIFKSNTEIVNCSPKTIIKCLRTINYDQLKGEVL